MIASEARTRAICRNPRRSATLAAARLPVGQGDRRRECRAPEQPPNFEIPVILSQTGNPFSMLPSTPILDQDGRQRRDDNGRPRYSVILKWRTRGLQTRFSEVVIALILQEYPEALDEGGR